MDAQRWVAFSTDPAGGNPAGVAVGDARPDAATMQRAAAEVGFSETAFLAPTGPGGWWVRYYSPVAEVPFCGHATIAAAVSLGTEDPSLDQLVLDSAVGPVEVRVERGDGPLRATLTSPAASVAPLADELLATLLSLFGWTQDDLDPSITPVVGHSGADHPIVPLRSRAALAAMDYPFDELRTLMEDEDWTTIEVVHREDERTFHARDPFPVGGIVEDPATGSAAAALGAALRAAGSLPADGRFTVHQGDDLGRPSLLHVDASGHGGVRVTGAAVPMP